MGDTWTEATAWFYDDWSVANAIEAFGSKRELVAAFAGVDASQKGFAKDPAYKTANKNIGRWLVGQKENRGRGSAGKQASKISPASQKKLNDIVKAKIRKDKPLPHIEINGKVKVNSSDKKRKDRKISKNISWDTLEKIARVARDEGEDGGEDAATQEFSDWYIGEGEASMEIDASIHIS